MQILVTGATGFIGAALCADLQEDGHSLTALVRNRKKARNRLGDNVELVTDLGAIPADARFDAVINLAGASIAGGLWTKKRRAVLLSSRVGTTAALAKLFERLDAVPKVVVSASAAGYYGNRGDDLLYEDEPPQNIFMSQLCQQWEDTALQLGGSGTRHVIARLGVVFGADGGAFPQLSRSHRFGIGVVMGDGRQYFPWVHVRDVIRFFGAAIGSSDMSGPYNVVAPKQLRQADLVAAIAAHGRDWLRIRIPAPVLKLLMGELSDLFLKSQHMSASRLQATGFEFAYPDIDAALEQLLGR